MRKHPNNTTSSVRTSFKNSAQFKNKLTRGCNNYEDIKEAYLETQMRTQHGDKDSTKGRQSRSFKKFLEDQEHHQQIKEMRIKQFQTEIIKAEAEELTSRPELGPISKRICNMINYNSVKVVDRLTRRKQIKSEKSLQTLFSPKILPKSKSLKRNQNISQLLHSDAKRRQKKKCMLQTEKSTTNIVSCPINNNTYKLVCQKMYSQFCQIVPEQQKLVPMVMVWAIFLQIFGIDLNPHHSSRSQKICQDLTSILCLKGSENVQRQKLWEFIEIIVKKTEANPKILIEVAAEIIKQFGHLYTCRIAKPRTRQDSEDFAFVPQTLKSSSRKAQRHRNKLLSSAKSFLSNSNSKMKLNQEVTLQQVFMIDYMMKKDLNEKKKIIKQEEEVKACTFKPKLTDSFKKIPFLPPRCPISFFEFSNKKKGLHNSIKQSKENKQNWSHNKSQKIVTESGKQNLKASVKSIQNAVMRMKVGRKDRQLSNSLKTRGYPKNVSNWTSYTQQQKTKVNQQHKNLQGYAYKKINL